MRLRMVRENGMPVRLSAISSMVMLLAGSPAAAEITITKAEYANGVTLIRGEVERPSARVTLDRRYSTRSNRYGEFVFRVRYRPDDCTVAIRAGRDTHPVTISNCFLRGKGISPMRRIPR